MKKLLLSCLIGLGVTANAQIIVNENFEGTVSNWTSSGAYTPGTYTGIYNAPASCDGTQPFGALLYGATSGGRSFSLTYTKPSTQTSNGKKMDISFDWSTENALDPPGAVTGNIVVSYSTSSTGNTFTTIQTIPITQEILDCQHVTASIAEGIIPVNSAFRFRIAVTTTNANPQNGFFFFVDNISVMQEVTEAPTCTTVTLPANGVNPNGSLAVTWTAATSAAKYKVYVGTASGNYDIANGVETTGLSYPLNLAENTTYYVKVIPTNSIADAEGCSESSFTTGDLDYCSPVTNATNSDDYITNVKFEGIDNTTASGSTSYSDFTGGAKAVVTQGDTDKVLSVSFTGDAGFPDDHLAAFIDWNGNKIFDEGEAYPLASHSAGGTFTANVTVPADAAVGDTRMRVVLLYNTGNPVLTGCDTFSYGEIEDYTVQVQELIVAPTCTTITSPADGATDVTSPTAITWNAVDGADGYKVYIGTASGNYDVQNGTEVTDTSYEATLSADTQYFVKVVPFNTAGDAEGCGEISFTLAPVSTEPDNLIIVDLSVENKVTFTATTGLSAGTVSGSTFDGFYLKDLFSNAGTVSVPVNPGYSGTPTFTAASVPTNNVPKMFRASSGSDPGMNVYGYSATGTTTFTTGQLAFTGNVTWTVSSAVYNAMLTAPDNGGEVYFVADSVGMLGTATLIGKYSVVKPTMAVTDTQRNNISVYPNPFHEVLKISDAQNVNSVFVHDMAGRKVKTLAPAAELNLSSLKEGVYIVNLQMKDGSVQSFKVIKK